uniref:Myb-like domain-containing protein n=1 Tax=Kalanchoe fedtschenkoi TaxID=63787 RepID=A0A7N0T7B4_KALFE
MADQSGGAGGGGVVASGGGGGLMREYRKGNWTLQETMVLIEAKKMDDERRLKRPGCSSSEQQQVTGSQEMLMMIRNKPAELRWKWVEDYCWRRGCFRSQNQCNDKWDNLMRDYKKVRDYERKLAEQNAAAGTSSSSSLGGSVSYWNMDRSERKERSLPSNMSSTIYEALVDVVEKKVGAGSSSAAALLSPATVVNTSGTPTPTDVLQAATPTIMPPTAALSLLHQQHLNASVAARGLPLPEIAGVAPLPLPPPLPSAQPNIPTCQPATTTIRDSSDSDTSSDSPAKRRRKDKGPETGGGPPSSRNEAAGVANAISKGASKISEAIQASESRREERHREMLGLKQRRLQIEEARMEVNRQGMSGLAEAINNLANSIMALAASNNNHGQAPPPPPP